MLNVLTLTFPLKKNNMHLRENVLRHNTNCQHTCNTLCMIAYVFKYWLFSIWLPLWATCTDNLKIEIAAGKLYKTSRTFLHFRSLHGTWGLDPRSLPFTRYQCVNSWSLGPLYPFLNSIWVFLLHQVTLVNCIKYLLVFNTVKLVQLKIQNCAENQKINTMDKNFMNLQEIVLSILFCMGFKLPVLAIFFCEFMSIPQ